MKTLKSTIALIALLLAFSATAYAEGETRETAVSISGTCELPLLGEEEKNTTTWFVIEPASFGENDLVTVTVNGKNYGDIIFIEEGAQQEMFLTGGTNSPTAKRLWVTKQSPVYVAIAQDGPGATASFSLSVAEAGETRFNAIPVAEGTTNLKAGCSPIWCSYTASASKEVTVLATASTGNAVDADGYNVCMANDMLNGFRMHEGSTVYFPVHSSNASVTITLSDPQVGYYADMPLNITGMASFTVDLPADPNATKDSSAQSERYWLYEADKSGFLMWGTDDAKWQEGMWGVGVNDTTSRKRLDTPKTEIQAGMITYTIPVEAGHVYLISQVVCYSNARTVTVYTKYEEPMLGDTKDNPIILTLNKAEDLGRTTSLTKYYAYTAKKAGMFTATVHAGGQVRATTPHDGSWNIRRDYDIQEMHMHVDDEIWLEAGETLLLEVTLTSDIDIHVDGSDAGIPNYSIVITRNDGESDDEPVVDSISSVGTSPVAETFTLGGAKVNGATGIVIVREGNTVKKVMK